jgi:hypothetical protein
MKYIINKIKLWYWWHFEASEMDKMMCDILIRARAIGKMQDNIKENIARISPGKFFIDPKNNE